LKDEISEKISLKKASKSKKKKKRKEKMGIQFDRKKKTRRMKFEKKTILKMNTNKINSN
jgi:hypothetical protein